MPTMPYSKCSAKATYSIPGDPQGRIAMVHAQTPFLAIAKVKMYLFNRGVCNTDTYQIMLRERGVGGKWGEWEIRETHEA